MCASTAECLNREKNKQDCPCTSTDCERHGICCQCVRHHKSKGGKPSCLR